MSDIKDTKAWSRVHQNGMIALVFELPYDSDRFAIGALPSGKSGSMTSVRGTLQQAQGFADAMSKCQSSCSCPPWES